MIKEVASPLQNTQANQCMKAEMLADVPPVIWSIPSGTALATNAPKSQKVGINTISSCIANSVGFATGSLSSHIEISEAITENNHSVFKE
jgi:hypothetical protein